METFQISVKRWLHLSYSKNSLAIFAILFIYLVSIASAGYINGTVYENSIGISGATVAVNYTSTLTNSMGNYSLNLTAGTYIVNISKMPEYYPNSSSSITVSGSSSTFYNATLTKKPTGTITGRVCSFPGCIDQSIRQLSNRIRWFF